MTRQQGTLFGSSVEIGIADEWYTPRWVFDAMGVEFDLDVAAPIGGPWHVPAARYYTSVDDGLSQPWAGTVWCNPPYSRLYPWAERWAEHPAGALLATYAPEARTTPLIMAAAEWVVLCSVKFVGPDGTRLKPRHGTFVAFRGMGDGPARRLAAADRFGALLYGERAAA